MGLSLWAYPYRAIPMGLCLCGYSRPKNSFAYPYGAIPMALSLWAFAYPRSLWAYLYAAIPDLKVVLPIA